MNTQHHPSADGVVPEESEQPTGLTGSAPPRPPTTAGSPPPPIRRSRSDNVVGGVCGGLGAAAGVDPLWFRLGFIFLALSSGVGIILYLIAWVVIPEANEDEEVRPTKRANDSAVVFGIFLLAAGAALLADSILPWFDRVVWPLAVIGVGLGLLYFSFTGRYRS